MGNILHNLQQGLVGHWDMNGNAKDKTPYGNHGVVSGATLTADRYGVANRAYLFDGTDDIIRITDKPEFNFGSAMSAFCWTKIPNNGVQGNIFTQWDTNSQRAWELVKSTANKLIVYVTSGGVINSTTHKQYIATTDLFNDAWGLFGLTFDTNVLKVYFNGVDITDTMTKTADNTVNSIFNSTADITIGAALATGSPVFFATGSIGDCRLYNRALSATEVSTLYKLYSPNILTQ